MASSMRKKVDVRGLAGGFADAGEVFAQQKLVDHGGFSDVGLARERDLRQAVLRAVGDGGDGADKFRVMQIHAGLLTAGCRACGAVWVRGSALRARWEPKLSPAASSAGRRAASSTRSALETVMNCSACRTVWSISSRSFSFSAGMMTVLTPWRRAAMVFFLQPADGEHAAPDGNFTRHGDVAPHGAVRKCRDDGGADRDTGGRPVLRDGSLREVDVNVLRFVEIRGEAQRLCARADKAHGCEGGFLHHVAQIAGQFQLAGTVDHVDLDLKRRAADGCPRKARDKPDLIGRDVCLRQEFADAEEVFEIAAGDGNALGRLVGDEAHGALAAERGDLPLKTADAGFTRVAGNDLADRVVGDAHLRALHAVLFSAASAAGAAWRSAIFPRPYKTPVQ